MSGLLIFIPLFSLILRNWQEQRCFAFGKIRSIHKNMKNAEERQACGLDIIGGLDFFMSFPTMIAAAGGV
jgi:hypothetical protein